MDECQPNSLQEIPAAGSQNHSHLDEGGGGQEGTWKYSPPAHSTLGLKAGATRRTFPQTSSALPRQNIFSSALQTSTVDLLGSCATSILSPRARRKQNLVLWQVTSLTLEPPACTCFFPCFFFLCLTLEPPNPILTSRDPPRKKKNLEQYYPYKVCLRDVGAKPPASDLPEQG